MARPVQVHLSDLRSLQRLADDATAGFTNLVQEMHHTILRAPVSWATHPPDGQAGVTGFACRFGALGQTADGPLLDTHRSVYEQIKDWLILTRR